MSLLVEDGSGLASSESYVSVADCATYATNRALPFDVGSVPAAEASLRRATAYIDGTYRDRFSGFPLHYGVQALAWPRIGAYIQIPDDGRSEAFTYDRNRGYYVYLNGIYYFPTNVVPPQIITATCEAAVRELARPGSLAPDLKRGGGIQEVHAGSVGVTYFANANPNTIFQVVDLALASLLMPSNRYSGRAVRG